MTFDSNFSFNLPEDCMLMFNSSNPPFRLEIEERGFEVKIRGDSYFQYKQYMVLYENQYFNLKSCAIIKSLGVD